MLSSKHWNRERYITVVVVFTTENAKKKKKHIQLTLKFQGNSVGERLSVK